MPIQPKQPTAKGPAEWFTGDVWLDAIARGEEPSRVRVSVVRFTPSARTAWHAHAASVATSDPRPTGASMSPTTSTTTADRNRNSHDAVAQTWDQHLEVSAIGLGGSLRRLGVEAIDLSHQHRVDPQVRCRGLRRWAAGSHVAQFVACLWHGRTATRCRGFAAGPPLD